MRHRRRRGRVATGHSGEEVSPRSPRRGREPRACRGDCADVHWLSAFRRGTAKRTESAPEPRAWFAHERFSRSIEKSAHIEDRVITIGGREHTISLYAQGGAVGVGELTETGDLTYTPLRRIRIHHNRDKSGGYRWYCDYELPDHYDNQTITVRLHTNAEDQARRFNRTENVRPIPPGDPDFARLYPRRLDAESINRGIDDSLWIGRAHGVGHARQHLNLLGYALMVNGLALHRYQHRAPDQIAA